MQIEYSNKAAKYINALDKPTKRRIREARGTGRETACRRYKDNARICRRSAKAASW